MSVISRWIKSIVFYMILNTILMNLLGDSRYKKHISIVSGLVLVMIVITPLLKILHMDDELDYNIRFKEFAVEAADFQNSLNNMEKDKADMVFREYKDKIKNQVEEIIHSQGLYLVDLDISLNTEPEREDFGEITGMNVVVSEKAIDDRSSNSITIDEVIIQRIDPNNNNNLQPDEKIYSPVEMNIKNMLSDFYGIESNNINISIERDG